MIDYELYILIAIFSFVYTNILTEPDMIFNSLYKWADNKMPRWLFYPFIHCEKCNAGQISLFVFLFKNWIGYIFIPLETFFIHVISISFCIFITYTIKQTSEKLWQKN